MTDPKPMTTASSVSVPAEHDYRYCPMCRTELTSRELFGRHRQQCPACDWIHFKDPKVGAGVLAEQAGQVILGRRGVNPGKGLWGYPSGFVEIDETPEETAVREYKEETGLDVQLTGLFDLFHFFSPLKGSGMLVLYRGQVVGGRPEPMDDVIEIGFFAPVDLPPDDQIAFESNREALRRWRLEKAAEQG